MTENLENKSMTPIPQHSPAPWTVKGFTVTKSNGFKIKQERPAGAVDWDLVNKIYEADAMLIAKAPEMYLQIEKLQEEIAAKDKELKNLKESNALLGGLNESGLKEIERLKGLIKEAFYSFELSIHSKDYLWNNFKKENNL